MLKKGPSVRSIAGSSSNNRNMRNSHKAIGQSVHKVMSLKNLHSRQSLESRGSSREGGKRSKKLLQRSRYQIEPQQEPEGCHPLRLKKTNKPVIMVPVDDNKGDLADLEHLRLSNEQLKEISEGHLMEISKHIDETYNRRIKMIQDHERAV